MRKVTLFFIGFIIPCTKRINPPIKLKWMKTGRKGGSLSGYAVKKLFGIMNFVVIENLGIASISCDG